MRSDWPGPGVALLLTLACGGPVGPQAVGTLEVVQVELAPTTSARVREMRVEEGDPVQVGDTVAILAQVGLADQVDEARARLRTAQAQLAETERGSRPAEIARAEHDLAAAVATERNADADLERARHLVLTNVISRQDLDRAAANADEAKARRQALAEELQLVKDGPRAERRAAARAEVARAQAALSALRADQGDLVLVAPLAGTVMVRAAEPGEVLAASAPAVMVGDASRPWVRVYVGQDVLPMVQVGDSVVARLDAFPDSLFRGRVVALATRAEYTPRVALTEKERADLLFGVKVQFDDRTGMLKPGLPVTVTFGRVGGE